MPSRKTGAKSVKTPSLAPGAEAAVGITVDTLSALYVLDGIKGFGPQKFKQLREADIPIAVVVAEPSRLPTTGKRGDALREQLAAVADATRAACRQRAIRQIHAAHELGAAILTYDSPHYPPRVYASNNPIAILYVRGNRELLTRPNAIACVGSRSIRSPYTALHQAFARVAHDEGFSIVSGFALGADSLGHQVARAAGGTTICCMPGGLDRPFPPENRDLWDALLCSEGAVFVSEFPFGTGASSLTLRKRNKLIVAFAQGVLVSQSSATGGAMNAYRFAREQGKPVATFAADETQDTTGNRQIAEQHKEQDAEFPITATADDYRQWLRRLSSST